MISDRQEESLLEMGVSPETIELLKDVELDEAFQISSLPDVPDDEAVALLMVAHDLDEEMAQEMLAVVKYDQKSITTEDEEP
ncbi:MAG: hypothetical protein SAK29_12290 [Scytonema sp. PMC 1069.18]|nr:hypothetical protein [Scytonema sp. PMC 1069.18]MEC4885055.1 hypothetical protein [Scytonema sp. PMC 1070.18]